MDESAFSFTIAVFPFTAMVLCNDQNFRPHQGVMAMTTRDAMPQGSALKGTLQHIKVKELLKIVQVPYMQIRLTLFLGRRAGKVARLDSTLILARLAQVPSTAPGSVIKA